MLALEETGVWVRRLRLELLPQHMDCRLNCIQILPSRQDLLQLRLHSQSRFVGLLILGSESVELVLQLLLLGFLALNLLLLIVELGDQVRLWLVHVLQLMRQVVDLLLQSLVSRGCVDKLLLEHISLALVLDNALGKQHTLLELRHGTQSIGQLVHASASLAFSRTRRFVEVGIAPNVDITSWSLDGEELSSASSAIAPD